MVGQVIPLARYSGDGPTHEWPIMAALSRVDHLR